jgi:hypothetical protein
MKRVLKYQTNSRGAADEYARQLRSDGYTGVKVLRIRGEKGFWKVTVNVRRSNPRTVTARATRTIRKGETFRIKVR